MRVQLMKAYLVLEDGSIFSGEGFGATGLSMGEVVFNTGMVGYELSLTDPSYNGQILCQTYPLVGNYGVPPKTKEPLEKFFESDGIKVAGYILQELCEQPSHWAMPLGDWFLEEGKIGIRGIDTRALTKKLREHGVMLGMVAHGDYSTQELLKMPVEDPNKRNLVAEVSRKTVETFGEGKKRIALIDCGTKNNIIRCLVTRGCTVDVVPWDYPADKILGLKPDGVVISNGPGDPATLKETIRTIKTLTEAGLPIFGICLGNQLLALAFGGSTYKLKYGHRSQNQPCLEVGTKRCFITSQNHGFAVDKNIQGLEPWFVNANDGTIEGLKHPKKPIFSVQFHPEHRPGPVDTEFLFDSFLKEVHHG